MVEQRMADWVAWYSKHGVDIRNRADAIEVDLSEMEPDGTHSQSKLPANVVSHLKTAFAKWKAAGQDPQRFRAGVVRYKSSTGIMTKTKVLKALR